MDVPIVISTPGVPMQPHLLADRSKLISQPSPQSDPLRPFAAPGPDAETGSAGARIASTMADNHELRAELNQLRAERDRLLETQRRIMEVLGAKSPDKLVHDLRNVLNERDLLKALVDQL